MSEHAAEKSLHTTVAERLIDGRSSVGQPHLSPDGTRVAFVVATTNLEKNTSISRIWIDDAPVSSGDHDGNPTWAPDGRFLAFTSRRNDQNGPNKGESTLHIMPIAQPGETRQLCSMPDGLGYLAWSPDGATIAFTSRTQDDRYTKESVAWQAPRKVERFFSRLNGEDWVFDRPQHIYAIAANGTGAPRNLTSGEFQHGSPAWLPDSSGLVISAQRHDTWDTDLASDLYFLPADADTNSEDIRCLTAHDGTYDMPSVSPDGTSVAFIGAGELETLSQNFKVGVIPISSDGLAESGFTWASAGLDRTFLCMAGPQAPVWENNSTLLATAEDRGDTHLFRVTGDGSTGPVALTSGQITVHSYSTAAGTTATAR